MPGYKCANFGQCSKADGQEVIDVAPGAEPFCPECEKPMVRAKGEAGGRRGVAWWIIALPLVFVLGVAAWFLMKPGDEPAVEEKVSPPPAGGGGLVRLHGSDTVALAARILSEAYARTKGAEAPRFEIKGEGSQTAFPCLAAKSCDIGMSSRKIKPEEVESLKALGDMTSNEAELVIVLDTVAAALNPASTVEAMPEGIARDKTCTPIGGPPPVFYIRDPRSATRDFSIARLAGKCEWVSRAKVLGSNAAIDAAVAADPNGIAFLSQSAIKRSKKINVGAVTELRQSTEADPWTRRLYFYVPPNASAAAKDFAAYARTAEAQKILEGAGFVGQTPEVVPPPQLPTNPPPPPAYTGLSTGSDRVTIDLRFRHGSRELDSKAMDDLGRIVEILKNPAYAGRHIVLVGFADSSGERNSNLALSKDRASAVSDEMKKRGINPAVVTGFGQDLPVAPNDTEEGREKNRRVEVWLRR